MRRIAFGPRAGPGGRGRARRRRAGALALALLGVPAGVARGRQAEPGPAPAPPAPSAAAAQLPPAGELLGALFELRSARAWERLDALGTAALAALPVEAPAWEVTARLVAEARYERGALGAVEELARTGRAVRRPRAADADPVARALAIDLELLRARALEARGAADEACALFAACVEALSGWSPPWRSRFQTEAGLDRARALEACGRAGEARAEYARLARAADDGEVRALARVLGGAGHPVRTEGPDDGPDAPADAALRAADLAVAAALPAARARLAAALGRPTESLPAVRVGAAPHPGGGLSRAAFTRGDPRLPGRAPVVVVTAELVALELAELETLLVHELGHAVLLAECGLAYEALPPWATEGLSHVLAGEVEALERALVGVALERDPDLLLGPTPERALEPRFETAPGEWDPPREAGLALVVLLEERAARAPGDPLASFVARLADGATLEQLVRESSGLAPAEFLERARARVVERLLAVLEPARADLERVDAGRRAGPAAAATETARLLGSGADGADGADDAADREGRPALHPLAQTYARVLRAQALEALARWDEAAAAWDDVLAHRADHRRWIERARLAAASDRARAGALERARGELAALAELAITPGVRGEARARVAALDAGR